MGMMTRRSFTFTLNRYTDVRVGQVVRRMRTREEGRFS